MITRLNMKTSENGLKFIKDFEGCVLHVYKDVAMYDTIGIGHLLTESERKSGVFKNGITEQQAIELLKQDIVDTENAVNGLVKVEISQNQFDALVSFTFNLGSGSLSRSTLLKKLNAGDYNAAGKEFLKWDKALNPKTKRREPVAGLTRRRKAEAELWSKT
jgi:lysozyme